MYVYIQDMHTWQSHFDPFVLQVSNERRRTRPTRAGRMRAIYKRFFVEARGLDLVLVLV